MALENTFRTLQIELQRLREALEELSTTVDEDKPARDNIVVAARLGDSVLGVRGILEEALTAAGEAARAVTPPMDTQWARRALSACQDQFHRFTRQFSWDLVCYERIDDLMSVARERGRHWSAWVTVVRQALDQCRSLSDEVDDALFLSWQDLAEKLGAGSVSVQNTTVGQQITLPSQALSEDKEFARQGIT